MPITAAFHKAILRAQKNGAAAPFISPSPFGERGWGEGKLEAYLHRPGLIVHRNRDDTTRVHPARFEADEEQRGQRGSNHRTGHH